MFYSPASFCFMRTPLLIVSVLFVLTACNDDSSSSFQGYGEGDYIDIAAPIAGRLHTIFVNRGDEIEKETLLFALENTQETAMRDQRAWHVDAARERLIDLQTGKRPVEIAVLEAQLTQAMATEEYAKRQLARDEALVKTDSASKARYDDSKRAADTATAHRAELAAQIDVARLPGREAQIRAQEAELSSAQAALTQAEWTLSQMNATSPATALVFDTFYRKGEWIAAGTAVVRLLPPENIKVRFFVPETVVGTLTLGQKLSIQCNGCKNDIPATLSFIAPQAEYTPPIIYSNETRSKLVFMIEARPAFQDATRIHPGQPVTVTIP